MEQSDNAMAQLEKLRDDLKDRLAKKKQQLGEETKVISMGNEIIKINSDPRIDDYMKQKLRLQSHIEAVMKTDVVSLPEDNNTLLEIYKEKIFPESHDYVVSHFNMQIKKLEDQNLKYKQMLDNAKYVNNKVKELSLSKPEKDILMLTNRRHAQIGKVFRALRKDLNYVLKTAYAPSNVDGEVSVENLLKDLVQQFNENPNDPYINLDSDKYNPENIEMLIEIKLAIRDKDNIKRLRLIDPRRN